jgi:Spirocyclase AveC-like
MAVETAAPPLGKGISGSLSVAEAEARPQPAVKVWAVVGGLSLAFEAYVIVAWVASGHFKATPTGSTPQTGLERFFDVFWQAGGLLALAGFVAWFVVRPWRREGRLSTDGLLVLCFALIEWQDPLCNWIKPWGTYNTHLVQWGSWVQNIPGWMSPNGSRFAEPLLVMVPVYVWAVFGFTIIGCAFMRRVKKARPRIGTLGLIASCYGFFLVTDFVLEAIWMRTGIWAYPGGGGPTFFAGTRYDFPIKESVLWGAAWCGFTCMRYFRNDRGQAIVERGVDSVKAGQTTKTFMRFLALFAGVNVAYLCLYNIPMNFMAMHDKTWNPAVQKVSYMNDDLCDGNTGIACPTKNTPIPWETSGYVGTSGRLVTGGSAQR